MSGTADSFLLASSATKTRLAIQVTACKLLKAAYPGNVEDLDDPSEAFSLDNWSDDRKQQSPQFQYWYLVLTMAILLFIRSIREANFNLYRQALCQLMPLCLPTTM